MREQTSVFIDEVKDSINQTDEALSNLIDNVVAVIDEIKDTLEEDDDEGIDIAVACLKELLVELGVDDG